MTRDNRSMYFEDEDASNHEMSSQSYLDEKSILKNFNLSPQEGEAGNDDSSDSMCPLGLRLNKTPSFLELVRTSVLKAKSEKEDNEHLGRPRSTPEIVKTGNIPAASIQIGNWTRVSRHQIDLSAKIYYAKRKLVWEVLEGALKSKIEIQWSYISAIRAIMPKNEPGTLEVELRQPPSYFREVTPAPRNHTIWEEASDFTGGQAAILRRHVVSFRPGILDKHFEKLLQYNQQFFEMTLKPFPSHESPYFNGALTNSNMSLSFNDSYESSLYKDLKYPYQPSSALPRDSPLARSPNPSISAINMTYTSDGGNMNSNHLALLDEGPSHNNQVYYQPSHVAVPLSHHYLGTIPENHVEPLSEGKNIINPGYDYQNYAPAVTEANVPAPQHSHNNRV